MPSIASRPKFINTSPRQIALALLGLVVVGTLFLVPEIDWEAGEENLLSSLFNLSGDDVESEVEIDTSPRASLKTQRKGPLDLVLADLNSSLTRVEQNKPQSRDQLHQKRKEALRIAKRLPDKAGASKKALRRFAAEVERVVAGKSPAELETLAASATKQLASDRVSGDLRARWMKISGVNDEGISAIYDGKAHSNGTFAPDFRIVRLWARQGYQHHGVWDPDARATIKVRGYITAENLEQGLIFINGKFNRPLDIRKTEDGSGRKRFYFKQSEDLRNSIFTFRLVSKDGQFYDKSYTFYPRITRFNWNGRTNGSFDIPWPVNDPRLDRYFFVGQSGRVKKQIGSVPSGGFASARRFESW